MQTLKGNIYLLLLSRNYALTAEQMFLLTLRFYATGGMLVSIGDYSGVAKSTASKIIRNVTFAICLLRDRFLALPRNEEEIKKTANGFFKIAKFPRVIGAIDCTHVKIQSPGKHFCTLPGNFYIKAFYVFL